MTHLKITDTWRCQVGSQVRVTLQSILICCWEQYSSSCGRTTSQNIKYKLVIIVHSDLCTFYEDPMKSWLTCQKNLKQYIPVSNLSLMHVSLLIVARLVMIAI